MATADDIEARILALLTAKVKQDVAVTRDTNIVADTGLDSVSVMDFVLELEDEFDINIPLDRIAEVKTVADLAAAVQDLGGSS
ncbi:phosphopantetheine-binding protein [Limibaculum sp. FT325]|uniref:acyl carrier protein n=1 Tax=Thermohalobaculum sediminis TaxID=2939436 RepID=UPI0020BFF70B|nr:phosphopantetheine-binding protein [Limibaculum sediminis]MCL5775965.1 phosphopantetheine-binding protein [Limibaculum sediminis]